jgi:hypothetical protein
MIEPKEVNKLILEAPKFVSMVLKTEPDGPVPGSTVNRCLVRSDSL